jgi:hypothetical protein
VLGATSQGRSISRVEAPQPGQVVKIDTHLSSYEQIRQAGLALVRFAELLS